MFLRPLGRPHSVVLVKHVLHDFLDRAHLRVHQHISLFVKRFAVNEQLANCAKRIGRLQFVLNQAK